MKNILTFIFTGLLAISTAWGHGGSHQPISAEKAQKVGLSVSKQFVKSDPGLGFGKLPESWAKLTAEQTTLYKKGKGYYIVKVNNPVEEKTLFVLMAISGEVYDANFSGDFKGLK